MIVGIVGKANCGKSTFFKALTLAEVEIANYPFATIKPNTGVGYVKVRDAAADFGKTSNPRDGYVLDEWRFVPVEVIDVAGLVPGAHEGKGMGNQFLDDLRQADVLVHVIDVSGGTNEKGEPVDSGSYDPAKDVLFLEEELDYWYCGILEKGWEKLARTIQQEKSEVHKVLGKQLSGLGVDEKMVEAVVKDVGIDPERPTSWGKKELMSIAKELRKRTKPMIIACNKIDVNGASDNLERLKKEFPDHLLIGCSSESELALREAAKHELIKYIPGEKGFEIVEGDRLSAKQKKALDFVKVSVLDMFGNTGVQQVIDKAVFSVLKYITVFPGGVGKLEDSEGNVLPDCFLMKGGSTALDFAYRLHSDFGDNFIRAIDVRSKQTVGKEHVLKNRDVVEIISGK